MEDLNGQGSSPALAGVPFGQKWDLLKPTIERLYIEESLKLSEVIKILKDRHHFDASESQYKYQIKKWNLKKSTPTSKKAALYSLVQKRAELGKSSALVRGGHDVDKKNLRRYLKTEARRPIILEPSSVGTAEYLEFLSARIAQFGNRVFMNWTMPFGTLKSSTSTVTDHVSPISDIIVTTPQSPSAAPSPTAIAVKNLTVIERTRLFAQGRHLHLLTHMDKQQALTLSTWMYQFWFFCFKTAKHWGRGPHDWTADLLNFNKFIQQNLISYSSPAAPGQDANIPTSGSSPIGFYMPDSMNRTAIQEPSQLCRWSIHYKPPKYESIPSPPLQSETFDLDDETNWPAWSDSQDSDEYVGKLSKNLETNDFSTIGAKDLPIATNQVVKAANRSPDELHLEALGFAIMSGNLELLEAQLENIHINNIDVSGLHPFHLAITYLNGAKECCNVFDSLDKSFSVHKGFVNDLGHTLLDQSMITILKSHTSCLPSLVDPAFKKEKGFEAENIDICGRWDADSDCVRRLMADGITSIPFEWKHVFCHTSAQAICHCIWMIFGLDGNPYINRLSGLFVRRCSECGLKLELFPLHTLVLIPFHLAQSGCKGETLFGVLACLLCLMRYGANPLLKANISVQALFGNEDTETCSHEELDPIQLTAKLPVGVAAAWSPELNIGWQVFCNVLRHSRARLKVKSSFDGAESVGADGNDVFDAFVNYTEDNMDINNDEAQEIYDNHAIRYCNGHDQGYFGHSEILAALWAAVQVELLTYRRLRVGDSWISEKFDMKALNDGLIGRRSLVIPFTEERLMKPICSCGEFDDDFTGCYRLEDAVTEPFSNLDDWHRSNYIECSAYW
ncbi:hypothetical protein ACLMJK_009531 [Lecanora helva]